MKKIIGNFILSALAVSSSGAYAENYNGKILGMSGAGVAATDFDSGALLNPALMANFDSNDSFNINLNAGVLATDEDDFIDSADSIVDKIDNLNGLDPITIVSELEDLRSDLLAFDNSTLRANAGASLQVSIPNDLISLSFFATSDLTIGATSTIDSADIAYINDLIGGSLPLNPDFNENDLLSSILATGALTTEVGVTFAKKVSLAGLEIAVGASPKYQSVESIYYLAQVSTFDEDDFDAGQYTVEESDLNLDLGLQIAFQQWHLGATLKNAIEYDYETVNSSRVIKVSPQLTVGTAFKNEWVTLALDVDANAIEEPVNQQDVQFSRLGLEFDLFDWAQLRLGYRHDIEGTFEDSASIGLGFSPFGILNVDIAGMAGDNDTAGVALQLGMTF